MTTPNANSTIADLEAYYAENAGFELTNDVTMAKRFAHAIRLLLFKPKRLRKGGVAGGEVEYDPVVLRQQLQQVIAWIVEYDADQISVVDTSFTDFDGRS